MPLHRANLPARSRTIWTHQTVSIVKRHKCRAPAAFAELFALHEFVLHQVLATA